MSIVEDDPLAVLPVAAAAASVAFARASDTTRGSDERRLQVEALKGALVEASRLLERGTSVVARLSAELDQSQQRTHSARCPGATPVCARCLGVALTRSGEIAICLRCGRVHELPPGEFRCAEPASVTVGGTRAEQRSLCRSHAAAARQENCHLQVVLASRPDRAALEEAARRSAVVGSRGPARAGRGRDA